MTKTEKRTKPKYVKVNVRLTQEAVNALRRESERRGPFARVGHVIDELVRERFLKTDADAQS